MGLVALGAIAVPVVADVPDARLVVSDVEVTPEAPEPGNTTSVEFTVENSAGSATGVDIEAVELRERSRVGETHAAAGNVGSLSAGDDVTLSLSTAFEEAGVHDLELAVTAVDEAGAEVTVTRPVTIVVGGVNAAGITDDVQIDVQEVDPAELDDEEDDLDVDLGADGILGDGDDEDEEPQTSLIRVEVTNFGTATAREVAVTPVDEDGPELAEPPARLALPDVRPGDAESVFFNAAAFDEPTTLSFEAGYTLGTERGTSETTFEYRPNRGEVVLTDVDMTSEDGTVTVTGNAANPGLGEINGAVVAVEETETVSPTYPAREYFVGAVPESEFVRFDVTADVDHDNATTVPVTVTYLADGEPYERTVELPYEPRAADRGDNSGGGDGVPLSVATAVAGSALVAGSVAVGWRRRSRAGD